MQTQQKIIPLSTNHTHIERRALFDIASAQLPLTLGILDWIPIPVAYVDVLGVLQACNEPFSSVLKQPRDTLLKRNLYDCIGYWPSSQIELVRSALQQAYTGQESVFAIDNEYQVRCQPQCDDGGVIKGCLIIALSMAQPPSENQENFIDPRHSHQIKFTQTDSSADVLDQVRGFADNIPEPLAYVDADGRFGFVNRAFAQLVSRTQLSIVNQPLEEFQKHVQISDIKHQFERAKSYESLIEERLLHLPDQTQRWIEMRWLLDRAEGPDSRIRGAYLICSDITENREARAAYEKNLEETERTLNSIDTPVAIVDSDMRFSFANKSMLDWYQLSREQFLGKSVREIIGKKYYEQSWPYIQKALNGDEISFMREFRFPDESTRWVRIRYVPKRDQNGNNNGFYVVVFDIHDLKTQQRILQQKQEELRRTSWLLSSHLDNSPLAALELDSELFIRRWSDQAEKLFGWQRTHVMGRSIWQLNLIGPDEPDTLSRSLAMVMAVKPQKISSLIQVTRQDGSKLWCEWYLSALLDERGELLSIFALVHDVHQRIQAEATLQQLAAFDALTSLPNRSSLQFELTQALDRAQRNNTGVAALFIDLDHFKNVNDTLGHRIGDQLLLSVARILKSCVRKRDIVSRMGGDEFMIIIEDAKIRSAAQHVAHKLLTTLNQLIPVEDHMLTVTASVGIAIYPDHGSDANTLLKNSDVAMYHAKECGKGRFEFYTEELARQREEQALIEYSLREAIHDDQLNLFYQPRVSCKNGDIDGAEVLLRWNHPELGDVAPKKFIRVAEETGIIFELGMWVFRNACIQLHQWQRKKMPIKCLSVNFSARQLIMNDLAERVGAILTETGCDARLIEIEITETSMLFDLAAIKRVVSSLKRLGVRIAIDDFGTGFSSLSHLQQLDIDALKIDQSFVRDLLQDSGDAAITRTVISLGRGLGLKVIAEGVENQEQLAFLQRYDCDFYQGFHFSPAVPADRFEALLANSR